MADDAVAGQFWEFAAAGEGPRYRLAVALDRGDLAEVEWLVGLHPELLDGFAPAPRRGPRVRSRKGDADQLSLPVAHGRYGEGGLDSPRRPGVVRVKPGVAQVQGVAQAHKYSKRLRAALASHASPAP